MSWLIQLLRNLSDNFPFFSLCFNAHLISRHSVGICTAYIQKHELLED